MVRATDCVRLLCSDHAQPPHEIPDSPVTANMRYPNTRRAYLPACMGASSSLDDKLIWTDFQDAHLRQALPRLVWQKLEVICVGQPPRACFLTRAVVGSDPVFDQRAIRAKVERSSASGWRELVGVGAEHQSIVRILLVRVHPPTGQRSAVDDARHFSSPMPARLRSTGRADLLVWHASGPPGPR
jgi:hypothetical protein